MSRRLLVTSALPYANGPIHIGHLLEYVQADIWVRFMRLAGHEVHFVCADDAHGTPIMLEAEKKKTLPERLVESWRVRHEHDFNDFLISFDNYHSTHSPENKELSEKIYAKLKEGEHIATRNVAGLYDPERKQFLSDRYVLGTCPRCGASERTGDSCSKCGAAYAATELIEPRSLLSGKPVETRDSLHLFFRLESHTEYLRDWISEQQPGPGPGPRLQTQVQRKLEEWFATGLKDWDISRDAPYFGFQIPGYTDKYFYVWLDAPIGYLASFANYCEREGIDFNEFVAADTDTEMYHFIGKDIINFHGLFWPAMLHAAGYRTPTRLFVHGFLTVNGGSLSKSKDTFITARSYYDLGLNPEWLRYYMFSKLSDKVEDIDLQMDGFVNQVNADLVNKLSNIPSRVAKILQRDFGNQIADITEAWIEPDFDKIADLYERRRYSEVCRIVMEHAEQVNRSLEKAKPWELAKQPDSKEQLHEVCSCAIESFRVLAGLLKPVLPQFAESSEKYLRIEPLSWASLRQPLKGGHQLGRFEHLMKRVEKMQFDALIEANRDRQPEPAETIHTKHFAKVEPTKATHEDFDFQPSIMAKLRHPSKAGSKYGRSLVNEKRTSSDQYKNNKE